MDDFYCGGLLGRIHTAASAAQKYSRFAQMLMPPKAAQENKK